jgi:hypothetical protein
MITWSEENCVEASQALVLRDILGIEKMAMGAMRFRVDCDANNWDVAKVFFLDG